MTTTTNTPNDIPRAVAICTLAASLDVTDVRDAVMDVIDMVPNSVYPVALLDLIRASFQSDDDGDDLMHEIDHETGACDDDPDCIWADGDDD